eukprot:10590106-Ditylum_brightwellii.AAC.1
MKTLKSTGGKDNQAPKNLIEALTTSPSKEFNSNIFSHCLACCANRTLLNIDTIANLANLTYQNIFLKKEWPAKKNIETEDSSKKYKILGNVAALT